MDDFVEMRERERENRLVFFSLFPFLVIRNGEA